jgi:hypothetical protein
VKRLDDAVMERRPCLEKIGKLLRKMGNRYRGAGKSLDMGKFAQKLTMKIRQKAARESRKRGIQMSK